MNSNILKTLTAKLTAIVFLLANAAPAFACPRSATNLKFKDKKGNTTSSFGKLGEITSVRAFAEGDVTLTLKDGTTYNFNYKQTSWRDQVKHNGKTFTGRVALPGWCVSVNMQEVGKDKACTGGAGVDKYGTPYAELEKRADTKANAWGEKREKKDAGLVWGEKSTFNPRIPLTYYNIYIRNKQNRIVAVVGIDGQMAEFNQTKTIVKGFPDPNLKGNNGVKTAGITITPLTSSVEGNFDLSGNNVMGVKPVIASNLPQSKSRISGNYSFVNYHAKRGMSVKAQIDSPQIVSCTENKEKQIEGANGLVDLGHLKMKNCADAGTNDETAISKKRFKVSKDLSAEEIGVRHSFVFDNIGYVGNTPKKIGSVKIDRIYSNSIPRSRSSSTSQYDANLFGGANLVTDSSFGCKTRLRENGNVGLGESSRSRSTHLKK